MDFSKRIHLLASEKMIISQAMQIHALDGLSGSLKNAGGRLMFHGGTSISTVHGSPRWSEDLDFMISPSMSQDLDRSRAGVEYFMQTRMDEIIPGSSVTLIDKGQSQGKVRDEDPGNVMRWVGRWTHPMRHGAVKMKMEFYISEAENTAEYQVALRHAEVDGVTTKHPLPCATLHTIWADKIMAMSARPAMKWRDVYDLGFVFKKMTPISDADLFKRLDVACRSYQGDMRDLQNGLGRPELENLSTSYQEFKEDIRCWLSPETFLREDRSGTLKTYFDTTISQIARARSILEANGFEIQKEDAREEVDSWGF